VVIHFFRNSFLYSVGIEPASAEHSVFVAEYYNGADASRTSETAYKTNLMNVNQKLIAKNVMANYLFYAAAAQQCDTSFIRSPSTMTEVSHWIQYYCLERSFESFLDTGNCYLIFNTCPFIPVDGADNSWLLV
jgi:hypothetical protein